MSVKSTFGIKRDVAIQVLISSIYKSSDEELEYMLECLPESDLRNYIINGTGWTEDERTEIMNISEFYEKGV
jgi:hypothetical protein